MTFISRRDLLKAAAIVPFTRGFQSGARPPVENLTATEMELLDAIVARLIPTDANGPGATEALAAHYIDHALGTALASSRPAYAAGLAAMIGTMAIASYFPARRAARLSIVEALAHV